MILLLLISSAFAEYAKCIEEWKKMYENFGQVFIVNDDRDDYGKMVAFSGAGINDLGDYHGCKDIDIANYVLFQPEDKATLAFCGPNSCTEKDYRQVFSLIPTGEYKNTFGNATVHKLGSEIGDLLGNMEIVFSEDEQRSRFGDPGPGQWIMVSIVIILGLIAIAAGTYDWYLIQNNADPEEFDTKTKIVLWFSYYSNYKRLFATPTRLSRTDPLNIVSCIWALSVMWDTFLNYTAARIGQTYVQNYEEFSDVYGEPFGALSYSGIFGLDSCWWLVAMITTLSFLNDINHKHDFSFFGLYLHRFWQFYPIYLFTFFFLWAVTPYVGDGPLWYKIQEQVEDCPDYWWANVLLINNFLPNWKVTKCLRQTVWFDNTAMYFIFSPLILYIYHKYSKTIAWVWSVFLMCLGVATSAGIADYHDYNTVATAKENYLYEEYLYFKPYCRWAPWGFGMICGLLIFSFRNYDETHEIYDNLAYQLSRLTSENRLWRYFWMIIGFAMINACIFLAYYDYRDIDDDFRAFTHAENVSYISLWHFGFGWGISCCMMPLLLGHFRVMIELMSSEFWVPLARLSFAALMFNRAVNWAVVLAKNRAYYLATDANI